MQKEKINNIAIKPVIVQAFDAKTVRGYEWFENPYNTCALIAKTKSGKTSVIYRVLEATLPKKSKIIIFCPSIKTDKTYRKMVKMLKEKDCDVKTYPHFVEGKKSILDQIVDEAEGNVPGKKDEEPEEMIGGQTLKDIMFNGKKKATKNPKKGDDDTEITKKKKLCAETTIIIDDLSSACRDKSLTRLLCKSRHLKMRIFISLHAITNLMPSGIRQISNVLLFPNINREKIESLADNCGVSFKDDTKKRSILWELYNDATSEPYNFLNLDLQQMTFKKNFSEIYRVEG